MESTKVIVSSSLMRKRLYEIINKPILEVEIIVDEIIFHLQDGSMEGIGCHSHYNHSPKLKFERKRWNELLLFLGRIPEQPVTFSYDVNDNGISLSGAAIGF